MIYVSRIYKCFSIILYPLLIIFLILRVLKKKENPKRFGEKLGHYKQVRPEGKLFWVSLASVGELNSAVKLIKLLAEQGNVVVTSVTLTSSLEFGKKDFSDCKFKVFHQFSPLDSLICVNRFLRYFKPDIAIFVESEIWVNMITETSKVCKTYLVNAKISPTSLRRWLKVKSLFVWLFGHFDFIFTSSSTLSGELEKAGLKATFLGNLKYDASYREPVELSLKKQGFTAMFASIHLQEMEVLAPEIKALLNEGIQVLLMPRHVQHAGEMADILKQIGVQSCLRTKGESLEKGKVYIIDTMGEAIDFYAFSDVIFIGGGLVDGIGGHNIIEGCIARKPVITGSFHFNCTEVVEEFAQNNAVIVSNTPAKEIVHLMQSPQESAAMVENAIKIVLKYQGIAQQILKQIL